MSVRTISSQIFKKSRSHVKIAGDRKTTLRKFYSEDTQKNLCAGVEEISRYGDLATGICAALRMIHPLQSLVL
jgi:hypothetical protein